jgi:glycosyltransferase involved in cell wall biosynthesis
LRILLLHQYFLEKNEGGGSRFNEISKLWGEMGHEITVLAGMVHYNTGLKQDRYKGKFSFIDEEFYPNVKLIRSHVSESYNKSFIGRLWAYFSFVFSSLYTGIFKAKGKYDVILVTSPPLFVGITGVVLKWIKRSPLVFEVRDLWPESAIDTGVLNNKLIIKLAYWFEKWIYNRASLINVLTPAFRNTLIEQKNVSPDKIIFIPNAADFSLSDEILKDFDRDAFRKNLGIENKKAIIYVGAHGVANHLIQLVETAELIKDEIPEIQFILVGAGMQKEMLKEEAKKRKLSNILFVDPVSKDKVFKYIMASDFGASILKKVDTFKTIYSNKTFDYMACKKPIFMLIDGVSRELVEEAKAGVYCEPENPMEFKKQIKLMLEKENGSLQEMGENGYRFAKDKFDRSKLTVNYLNHLKTLVNG